jgi:DNA-binding CsgD family transcriptional regulator
VANGLGNKEIGVMLGISAHTAKSHVAAVLAKLDARSRTEAVTIGLREGLLPL